MYGNGIVAVGGWLGAPGNCEKLRCRVANCFGSRRHNVLEQFIMPLLTGTLITSLSSTQTLRIP
jgi:hypothetical protein